ncbi:MAG: 2-dehydropantoate 2-reductase [Proteocatella sp.]
MKYLIIGTGGTGSSIGGFLALDGNDVTFISRGKALEAFRTDGLLLKSTMKGNHLIKNINFMTQDEYNSKADVIFICVKSYSVEEIIPIIKKATHENTVIIPIMNGYKTSELISPHLQLGTVLDGCMYISAFIESPGEVIQLGDLFRIVFGPNKGKPADLRILEEVANDLESSGIETILSRNIEMDTFKKFTFISACATCGAYYDISIGSMQKDSEYRDTFNDLCREIQKLGENLGMKFDVDIIETNLKIVNSLMPDTTSSLQKDMKAGNKSEIDGVLFKVVELGRKIGLSMPTYEKIAIHFGYEVDNLH